MWILIRGYINQLCGETPTDLCITVPAPTTNFVGLEVTFTETQCKAANNALYQSRQYARKFEDWLEMRPQRFVTLGICAYSYHAVVWVTSRFFEPLKIWWLSRKQQQYPRDVRLLGNKDS
jgi:hypothetical protein